MNAGKRDYLDGLQVLRVLACFGVVSDHCELFKLGHWGVSVFFILSGFVQMYTWGGEAATLKNGFLLCYKQLNKLYPLHLIMIFFDMLFLDTFFIGYDLLTNVFLIESWVPHSGFFFGLNGVAWFLSSILLSWLLFPYIAKCVSVIKNNWIWIIVSFFVILLIALIGYNYTSIAENHTLALWITYICPVTRMIDFIIGCNLAVIFQQRNKKDNSGSFMSSFFEIVLLTLSIIISLIDNESIGILGNYWFSANVIYAPISIGLVYFFACKRGLFSRGLCNNFILWLAKQTPYIFLIHQIVERILRRYVGFLDGRNSGVLFIFTVFLSIILGFGYEKILCYFLMGWKGKVYAKIF